MPIDTGWNTDGKTIQKSRIKVKTEFLVKTGLLIQNRYSSCFTFV